MMSFNKKLLPFSFFDGPFKFSSHFKRPFCTLFSCSESGLKPDPDPGKNTGSSRIRIRNLANKSNFLQTYINLFTFFSVYICIYTYIYINIYIYLFIIYIFIICLSIYLDPHLYLVSNLKLIVVPLDQDVHRGHAGSLDLVGHHQPAIHI